LQSASRRARAPRVDRGHRQCTGLRARAPAMPDSRPSFRLHVHERDDLRVDGILRLIEAASEPGPLSKVLQRLCEHAATIAHADVVSVYVREQSDEGDFLMLRANVGFPATMIGQVRLSMG